MVALLKGNLDVFNDTFAPISIKGGCINVDFEAEAVNNSDLGGRELVELGHALDLAELHKVSILELVTLVFMNSNNRWIGLGCIHNNERLGLLTIGVSNGEVIAIV